MNQAINTKLTPQIGLNADSRTSLIEMLNTILADENVIYAQTRSAHWNITGPQFFALHELLEKQYDELKLQADEIAERAVMLGGWANGTLSTYLDNTRLEETSGQFLDWADLIDQLRRKHEMMAALLREDIESAADDHNDEGTADLLVGLLRMHEQMAWMLRATISG